MGLMDDHAGCFPAERSRHLYSLVHDERYITTSDSTKLYAQSWLPSGTPRAFVVMHHGVAEHSGRYAHVAAYLANSGIGVGAFDARGHGRSEGRRGYIKRISLLADDLGLYLSSTRDARGDAPLFLMGHSLGGTVVAAYASKGADEARGLIISSPAMRLHDTMAPHLRTFSRIAGWLVPTLPTVKCDPAKMSRDPQAVSAYVRDPLVYHGRTPARTGAELVSSTRTLLDAGPKIRLPLLLFHGTEDKIWDPDGSLLFYELSQSPDKTLKIYNGFYHDTLHEPLRERVFRDILDWIDEKVEEVSQ